MEEREKNIYSYFGDAMLLTHLRKSDQAAFEEIYQRYWKKIYNESYKRLKSKELVEPVVKDVFVGLWKNRENEEIKNIYSYLFKSLRSHILELYHEGKAGTYFEQSINLLMLSTIHKGIN